MSYLPDPNFVEALRKEFPEYRVRWSLKNERWQLEQQVGRGALPGTYPEDKFDDGTIRAAEGYWLILEVSPRSETKCPDCGFFFQLPHLKITEARCEYCISRGLDGRTMLGYFPLGEALLQQLRKTDPKRDGIQKLAKRMDAKNKLKLDQARKDADALLNDALLDNKYDVFEIPHTSLGGAPMWVR
jgi:hypothetical protein